MPDAIESPERRPTAAEFGNQFRGIVDPQTPEERASTR